MYRYEYMVGAPTNTAVGDMTRITSGALAQHTNAITRFVAPRTLEDAQGGGIDVSLCLFNGGHASCDGSSASAMDWC